MDQVQSLRDGLSSADMGQHGIVTSNVDGTMQRAALFAVLRSMSAFAARVVANVFGKTSSQMLSLSDPRPLTSRAGKKRIAAKAKKAELKAKKAAKPKKRTPAAAKRRATRSAVAARAATLAVPAKLPAKPAAKAKVRTTAKAPKKPAKG